MSNSQRNIVITAVIFIAAILLCWGTVALSTNVMDRLFGEPTATPFVEDGYPGVLVTSVHADSPGEQGGLQPGHLILEADGIRISVPDDLQAVVAGKSSGEAILLLVDVEGELRQAEVFRGFAPPYLGIEVVENNPNARIHLTLPTLTPEPTETAVSPPADPALLGPAVVSAVLPETPAEEAGFEVGDVITAVNAQAVLSSGELAESLSGKSAGATVTITFRRGPDTLTRTVTLAPHPDDESRGFLGIELQSP